MKTSYRSQSQTGNVFAHNLAAGNSQTVQGHMQTSLYAYNGSLIKDFITKKEYFQEESTERRPALLNRYGFIAALVDGFNSDGNKRLEIALPESADLSITQDGGFSVFFWFLLKKQSGGVHRFIIKRGNTIDEMTPSVGILPNGTNLFIKMNSSKHRIETLFSNKKIEFNRMYSVAVTFGIDYMNDLTDISLFLDGLLDSQITVPGEPLHNQGNLYIGKSDSLNYGFNGCVADVLLIPRVIAETEIFNVNKECILNLNVHKIFGSYEIFSKKFERDILIQKYAQYTGNPEFIIENLELNNDELREIVKKFDQDFKEEGNNPNMNVSTMNGNKLSEGNVSEEKTLAALGQFLGPDDSDYSINSRKIAMNARFIYTVLFLVNSNDDEIDIKRVPGVFEILKETLHIDVDEKFIKKLAEIINVYNADTKGIKLQSFFKNLKFYTSSLYPDIQFANYGGSTKSNFYQSGNNINNNLYELNSVELHENLLLNSQNFKNYIDDDLERSLAKSNFTIRSLYSRIKSGRPVTSKGYGSSRAEEADYVNQHYEHIPEENKNEVLYEVEEGFVDHEQEEKVVMVDDRNDRDEMQQRENYEQGNLENNNDRREYPENFEINQEVKEDSKVDNNQEVKQEVTQSHPPSEEIKRVEPNSNDTNKQEGSNTNNHHNSSSPNPTPQLEKKMKSSKNIQSPERLDSPKDPNSMIQTNFDDVISNFDNKVMIKSSDRDTAKAFLDPDNLIPVNNLASSQDLNNQTRNDEILQTKNELEPKFPNDWNEGSFEIVISHCYECHKHKTTTRHLEHVREKKRIYLIIIFRHLWINSMRSEIS